MRILTRTPVTAQALRRPCLLQPFRRPVFRGIPFHSKPTSAIQLPLHRSTMNPPRKHHTTASPPQPPIIIRTPEFSLKVFELTKHAKWGWVMYRTTYDDNCAWQWFKDIIEWQSREELAVMKFPPDIVERMDWAFVEDREGLEGASRDELRVRFREWADRAFEEENPDRDVRWSRWTMDPRYGFFVQVDAGVLRSVVGERGKPPEHDAEGVGWVNFVDAEWWHDEEDQLAEEEDADGQLGERLEAIDGCRNEFVGWIRLAAFNLGPEFYTSMINPMSWDTLYQRPYEVVWG